MRTREIFKKAFRLIYILLLVSGLGCVLFGSKQLITINIALVVFITSVFVPLIVYTNNKRFDPFEPIYIFSLFFVSLYGISSLYVYNRKEIFSSSMTADIYRVNEVVPIIYVLAFSYLVFYAIYRIRMSKLRETNNNFISASYPKSQRTVIFLLYAISIIFRIYGYSTGKLGSLVQDRGFSFPGASILLFISNIWFVYFSYYTVRFFQKNIQLWTWLSLVIIEGSIVLISGDRRYVLLILFIILAAYYYKYKNLPWRILSIGGLFLFFIYLPFTTLYGYLLGAEAMTSTKLDFSSLIAAVLSQIQSMSIDEVVADFILNPIAESMFLLPTCQIAYTSFDIVGIHWGGVGIMNLINSVVPSFLIPRTDVRPYIQLFTDDALSYHTDYSPLTFQMPTEGIVCFGLYSLPVIYLLIGIVLSGVYKLLFIKHNYYFSKIIYISLIFWLTYCFQFGLLTTEFTTPFRVLIYYLLIYYCFGFNKKRLIEPSKS